MAHNTNLHTSSNQFNRLPVSSRAFNQIMREHSSCLNPTCKDDTKAEESFRTNRLMMLLIGLIAACALVIGCCHSPQLTPLANRCIRISSSTVLGIQGLIVAKYLRNVGFGNAHQLYNLKQAIEQSHYNFR